MHAESPFEASVLQPRVSLAACKETHLLRRRKVEDQNLDFKRVQIVGRPQRRLNSQHRGVGCAKEDPDWEGGDSETSGAIGSLLSNVSEHQGLLEPSGPSPVWPPSPLEVSAPSFLDNDYSF